MRDTVIFQDFATLLETAIAGSAGRLVSVESHRELQACAQALDARLAALERAAASPQAQERGARDYSPARIVFEVIGFDLPRDGDTIENEGGAIYTLADGAGLLAKKPCRILRRLPDGEGAPASAARRAYPFPAPPGFIWLTKQSMMPRAKLYPVSNIAEIDVDDGTACVEFFHGGTVRFEVVESPAELSAALAAASGQALRAGSAEDEVERARRLAG